jgi:murein DD-endopeptidase MepM/ murein hydrolase activator NlpD
MGIARVTLAFFSVGFLAGSFENAAGLGVARPVQRPPAAATAAFVAPPAAVTEPPRDAAGRASPARDALGPVPMPVRVPRAVSPEMQRALAEGRALPPAPRLPMCSIGRRARSPIPAPSFVSLPQGSGGLLPGVSGSEVAKALQPQREKAVAEAPEFILPIDRGRVTSMFNQGRYHPAIDLAAPLGTPVHATTRRQRVTHAGWTGGYGNLVIARDPQGRDHYYGHLSRILVHIGALLEQGDLLGLLGSTGHSTGPHVHYEVRTRGGHINPATLLFAGRRVGVGYAWNDAVAGTRTAAASAAVPVFRPAARPATRRATWRGHRARARYAARPRAWHFGRRRVRYARVAAVRYGQPRPR